MTFQGMMPPCRWATLVQELGRMTKQEKSDGSTGSRRLITNNGERFSSMCEENDFVLVRTLFIYKTSISWLGHHQMETPKARSTRSWKQMEPFSTGSVNNVPWWHCLLWQGLGLKLRKTKIGTNKSKQFDVAKLKDPGAREQCTIRNRYNILQDETAIAIDQSMGQWMMLLQKP